METISIMIKNLQMEEFDMAIENPTRDEIRVILKKAKRIAVVGLSDNPDRTSYMVSKAMQDAGYEIIPVNPKADEILGVKAVASLKEIEGHVDIVDVFRRLSFYRKSLRNLMKLMLMFFGRNKVLKTKNVSISKRKKGIL